MSQLNVDTIGSQTGTEVAVNSGHYIHQAGIPIQVVTYHNNITTGNNITSTSMTPITHDGTNRLELKITPKKSTSKIILYSAVQTYHEYAGHNAFLEALRDIDGGTSDQRVQQYAIRDEDTPNNYNLNIQLPYNFVDTPNTTSEVTYHFKARVTDSAAEFQWVRADSGSTYMQGQMFTLWEIGV